MNVRVIAATHQNLEERVKKNQFRKFVSQNKCDTNKNPPLMERSEDIPCLAEFSTKFGKKLGFERKFSHWSPLSYERV